MDYQDDQTAQIERTERYVSRAVVWIIAVLAVSVVIQAFLLYLHA